MALELILRELLHFIFDVILGNFFALLGIEFVYLTPKTVFNE